MNLKYYILTFILIFNVACKNKNKAEAAEFFKRANYHFHKNELDQALVFYNEAIEKEPDFADAYYNRGILLEKRGELEKAITDYEKAVNIDDTFKIAKLSLASGLSQINEMNEAQKLFESLSTTMADSLDYNNLYGQHLIRENKISEAKKYLRIASNKDPKNVEIITNLGYLSYLEKDWESAKKDFMAAIGRDPGLGWAWNNLSNVYAQENDWTQALEASGKAIVINKDEISFLNTHSLNLIEKGKIKDAEEILDRCEKLEEKNPYYLRNRAVLLLYSGDLKRSQEILLELELNHPEVDFLFYYLGVLEQKLGNNQKACDYFRKGKFLKDERSIRSILKC